MSNENHNPHNDFLVMLPPAASDSIDSDRKEPLTYIAEVTGSNPVSPTI